jgi:hypothetical protein
MEKRRRGISWESNLAVKHDIRVSLVRWSLSRRTGCDYQSEAFGDKNPLSELVILRTRKSLPEIWQYFLSWETRILGAS